MSDWIKMRTNLRRNPKVIAMSRYLSKDQNFINWLTGNSVTKSHTSVTSDVTKECDSSVTMHAVMRVTVCGLLEVWGSVNDVINSDNFVSNMCKSDIDAISEIPSFGDAMASVGWIENLEIECGDNNEILAEGLEFSNFLEFNTPEKARPKAKTQAQRAKEYRERKKAESENRHDRHESSRGIDKNRIDNKKNIKKNVTDDFFRDENSEGDVRDSEPLDEKSNPKPKSRQFKKPTLEEIKIYCAERRNSVDSEKFLSYYNSNGWKVGKNSMKCWKSAVITWEKNSSQNNQNPPSNPNSWEDVQCM